MTSSTLFSTQLIDSQTDENNNPKSKDCLSLKPSRELSFFHSKNRYTADLQLLNKKDEPVLYKIRTTAAKSYIVLPTAGLIPPRGVATVKIHMPMKEETRERVNDKFLVQAFVYNKNDLGDDQKLMNQVFEQHYKSLPSKEFQSAKLRVYFDSHTVIEEEMSEETGSVKHYSPSTAMTRDAPESASALFASKPQSAPSTAVKTALIPEVLTRSEAKPSEDLFTQVLKEERLDALSESSNRNRVDSFRTVTAEPYVYQIYSDKSRVSEPEGVLSSQMETESVKVSRNLKNEFERDVQKRNSLGNITNSLPRSFNSFPDNDTSMYTDISDVKSNMSFSEQLAAYKYKLDLLERKYNEQNAQMARLLQEREAQQKEAMTFRRSSMSFSTAADETKSQQNNKTQLDVWHLMVLCIVCMILGSLFR